MAAEKPDKKEKKDKKRADEAGVSKSKKDKKEKKEKKEKLAAAAETQLQNDSAAKTSKKAAAPAAPVEDDDSEVDAPGDKMEDVPVERTVVPFAVPLADEKGTKKVHKTIRKASKNNTLKRGVKEVVKTLRKSAPAGPGLTSFPGVVVIAGDISPQDVISHIPVLCEDHNVPFIFVSSRAELGAAAKTKRPTSVVMIMAKADGKKKAAAKDDGEDDEFAESYAALVKYAQKEHGKQAFWVKGESQA